MPTYRMKAPDGQTYQITGPEGATDEQIRAEIMRQNPDLGGQPAEPSAGQRYGLDILKGAARGAVSGIENIPAGIAGLYSLAGRGVEAIAPEGMISPEAKQQQLTIRDLVARGRQMPIAGTNIPAGPVAENLPAPETMPGRFAQAALEAVPATVGASKVSPLRAAGAGIAGGLTGEAAGQTAEAAGATPEQAALARGVGGLVGGGVGLRQAEQAAARAATPTIERTQAVAGNIYKQAEREGVKLDPQAAADFVTTLKGRLTAAGASQPNAQKAWALLSEWEKAPPGAFISVQNFRDLRRNLGEAAGSIEPSERRGAMLAKNALDEWISNPPPGAVIAGNPQRAAMLLREANADWAASERASEVSRQVAKAEARALPPGSPSAGALIRRRMAQVVAEPKLQRGMTPQELAQAERVAAGTMPERLINLAVNPLTQVGLGAAGLTGAFYTGDPTLAAAGLIGPALRGASALSARRQAKILQQMMLSRSPLAAQTMPQLSAPAAPLATGVAAAAPDILRLTVRPEDAYR